VSATSPIGHQLARALEIAERLGEPERTARSALDGAGLVHVGAIGGVSTFDNNGANGIDIEGNAALQFDGGTAQLNASTAFASADGTDGGHGPEPRHLGLTRDRNKNNGLAMYNGQNAKVRTRSSSRTRTTPLTSHGGTSVLDIGTSGAADPAATRSA